MFAAILALAYVCNTWVAAQVINKRRGEKPEQRKMAQEQALREARLPALYGAVLSACLALVEGLAVNVTHRLA